MMVKETVTLYILKLSKRLPVITMHYVTSSNILKLVGSISGFECLPLSDYRFRDLIHLIPSLHQVLVR